MILDARQPEKPTGVVIDHGTGRRLPFVIWCDFDTGEYEAHVPAMNGVDVIVDPYTRKPLVRRGRAVGKLELVPFGKAAKLGVAAPKKVEQVIQPMTKYERIDGMDQYKKLFFEVWRWRGNSDKVVRSQWDDYLIGSDFLDSFCLRMTARPVTIHTS